MLIFRLLDFYAHLLGLLYSFLNSYFGISEYVVQHI